MKNNVKKTANSISRKTRKRIIDSVSIRSDYVRNYVCSKQKELSADDYIEIITSAPVSIKEKLYLLENLKLEDITSKENEMVSGCISAANSAMKLLNEFDKEKFRLQLNMFKVNGLIELESYISEAIPITDYEHAKRYIENKFQSVNDNGTKDGRTREYDFYYKLFLYRMNDTGRVCKMEMQIEYILEPSGELQYISTGCQSPETDCLTDDECRFLKFINFFSCYNRGHKLDKWIPFEIGDVLYVDCRPYVQPEYYLVYRSMPDVPFDNCVLRSYTPLYDSTKLDETLRKGWFLKKGERDYKQCCMPMFYRAEIYDEKVHEGKVPDEYKSMEDISRQLKKDSGLGERLNVLIGGVIEKYTLAAAYVPVPSGDVYEMAKKRLLELTEGENHGKEC